MPSFEFVASAVISHHILGYTRPLSVTLQANDCNLLKSYQMAQRLIKILEDEFAFNSSWNRMLKIASTLSLEDHCRIAIAFKQK